VWPWLEIFLKNALGVSNGLKHSLLVGHIVFRGTVGQSPYNCMSWLVAFRSIGSRSSAIRWKLVKRLRGIESSVRPGNRNVSVTVF
jgi:hypothetical protein